MQVGVGRIDPANWCIIVRGGGADVRDYMASSLAAENCSELCSMGMNWGGLWYSWYLLSYYDQYRDPHYLKCIEASAAAPLNGLRLQHASQFNTMNLDPTVPTMNITDWSGCLRMRLELFD